MSEKIKKNFLYGEFQTAARALRETWRTVNAQLKDARGLVCRAWLYFDTNPIGGFLRI